MEQDELLAEKIRTNAEKVISITLKGYGVQLAYDLTGIQWMDGYLNRLHENIPADKRVGLVEMLGSFVGECIIRTYGGEWVRSDDGIGLQINERVRVFPFNKVHKRLENGAEDSIIFFFTSIPMIDKILSRRTGQ